MKRILTLALAALLVVAFAIPAFAAPKIELVGGEVKTWAHFDDTNWWGGQIPAVFGNLKFKFSADNFVFNVTTAYNEPVVFDGDLYGDWGIPSLEIAGYDFSLALPFMTLSGAYNNYYAKRYSFTHWGRELKLASDEKFNELAGFEWYIMANDDKYLGAFDSFHAALTIPVGEAFKTALKYSHDTETGTEIHIGSLNARYDFADDLYVDATVAKNLTGDTDDFHFFAGVGFPIAEGWNGTFAAQYGMTGFAADNDYNMNVWYDQLWGADLFEAVIDTRYNNESTNARVMAMYTAASDFTTSSSVSLYAEYVSNGDLSYENSNRPTYGWSNDSRNRGWNTYYDWVRKNGGNEFAFGVDGFYYITDDTGATDGTWDVTIKGMFAPDVIPVVISAAGYLDTYSGAAAGDLWYKIENWVGVRINPDIHFALYNRYNPDDSFDMDAALVYYKDNVTAKLTGLNLFENWDARGVDLFLGISF